LGNLFTDLLFVGFGTIGGHLLIFGVLLHLLLTVLLDDGSIRFAELKHIRVKDFVIQLLPWGKGSFIVDVDNMVLLSVATKAALDTGIE
jgi:hypothetical protein